MTPNTLRIALGLLMFGAAPIAITAFPQQAVSDTHKPQVEEQVLTYHVVDGEVRSTDLASGEVETLAGAPLSVMVEDAGVTINQASVVAADIEASNGVIHVIDAMLLPM